MSNHRCSVYNNKESYVANFIGEKAQRKATARWNAHVAKHGNVPMIERCSTCSGHDERKMIKLGKMREKRPSKTLRDEARDYNVSTPGWA